MKRKSFLVVNNLRVFFFFTSFVMKDNDRCVIASSYFTIFGALAIFSSVLRVCMCLLFFEIQDIEEQ